MQLKLKRTLEYDVYCICTDLKAVFLSSTPYKALLPVPEEFKRLITHICQKKGKQTLMLPLRKDYSLEAHTPAHTHTYSVQKVPCSILRISHSSYQVSEKDTGFRLVVGQLGERSQSHLLLQEAAWEMILEVVCTQSWRAIANTELDGQKNFT